MPGQSLASSELLVVSQRLYNYINVWVPGWHHHESSMIFDSSWESKEIPINWKLPHLLPIYKKVKNNVPGNYRPVSLTSGPGEITEMIILEVNGKHLKDNAVIDHRQCNFTRANSSIINLICFPNKLIKGKQSSVWISSKAFDTVSYSILQDKMSSAQLDKYSKWWVCSWVTDEAQRVLINGVVLGWWLITSGASPASNLGPIFFHVFLNYLYDWPKSILSKFAYDRYFGGAVDSL